MIQNRVKNLFGITPVRRYWSESDGEVEVRDGDTIIAKTRRALRVLETASPPTYYLPPADIDLTLLVAAPGRSVCEWKGAAQYWAAADNPSLAIAWSYGDPYSPYESLGDYLSFYPGRIECRVDGERVRPQPGEFYGGWVTSHIVGPIKGEPGTGHW